MNCVTFDIKVHLLQFGPKHTLSDSNSCFQEKISKKKKSILCLCVCVWGGMNYEILELLPICKMAKTALTELKECLG